MHTSYKEAQKDAKENPGKVVMLDSGSGWKTEMVYCNRRRRIVQTSISPEGMRIV